MLRTLILSMLLLLSLSVSSQTITRDSAKKVIPHSVMLELDSVPVVMVSSIIYIHENDTRYSHYNNVFCFSFGIFVGANLD